MNGGYTQGTIDALLSKKLARRPVDVAHDAELERLRTWGTEAMAARDAARDVTPTAVAAVDSVIGALS